MNINDLGQRWKEHKLDQVECINLDSQGRDSAFSVATQRLGKNSVCLTHCKKNYDKKWHTMSKLGMPDLLWFNAQEGIQRLRETEILE